MLSERLCGEPLRVSDLRLEHPGKHLATTSCRLQFVLGEERPAISESVLTACQFAPPGPRDSASSPPSALSASETRASLVILPPRQERRPLLRLNYLKRMAPCITE